MKNLIINLFTYAAFFGLFSYIKTFLGFEDTVLAAVCLCIIITIESKYYNDKNNKN